MHERGWHSDDAREPLRSAGAGHETKLCLRKPDQIVPILSDTKIAGERELERTGEGGAGNGGDDRLWHALAQRHGFIEESAVISGVVGPLAAGSAQGLCNFDKRWDAKMTSEVTGSTTGHDDNPNGGVAREFVQRSSERVAHFSVEIDAPRAAQSNNPQFRRPLVPSGRRCSSGPL